MSLLRRRGRSAEERALPLGSVWPISPQASHTLSGQTVDGAAALRNPAAWAAVRLLADTVSALPISVVSDDDRHIPLPTPDVLKQPAAHLNMTEWVHALMVSLLLRGNAFAVVVDRDARGLPTQIEPVAAELVTVFREPDATWEIRVAGEPMRWEDMLHLRAFTVPGTILGIGPVDYARQTLGVGLAVDDYTARWFGEGAIPSAVLSTDRDLTGDQARLLRENWDSMHKGRRKVAVLSGGLKFEPVTVAPDKNQLIDVQRFHVQQVARIFGVPPEMIGGDSGQSMTYSNVEQRSIDFLRYSVGPWLNRLQLGLSQLLPPGQVVRFNTGALLRADLHTRYDAHKLALEAGFLTVNEVRAIEDLPPIAKATP